MSNSSRDEPNAPVVVVEGLTKSFGDHVVLRGVDLTIRSGEIVAIVGGSGSGKTVLLDAMVGLLAADGGRVAVRDFEAPQAPLVELFDADENTIEEVRRHWAIVFQRNALFSGSVYDNMALWLIEVAGLGDAKIRPRVRDALCAVGLDPDEVMSRDRDELSGGMAKRVAIARALVMDPAIIFYDEPTTGLDPAHAGRVHELIAEMHDRPTSLGVRRTTVVITHDKDLLRRIEPRVIMLYEGRVFFDGPYDEFVQSDSDVIGPYFELMPVLQRRESRE